MAGAVDLTPMKVFLVIVALMFSMGSVSAQEASAGPQLPIVLQWADSLVGMGNAGADVKEFLGNVRFTQGNVTVKCDRAVYDNATNRAKLFGNVIITQEGMVLKTPHATYDGNTFIAEADGGVKITHDSSTISSQSGTYSTKSHLATFHDSVHVLDDTLELWSDSATYNRDSKVCSAWGRVVAHDTVEKAWMRSDSLYYDRSTRNVHMAGNAAMWSCKEKEDTLFLIADSIDALQGEHARYIGTGNVELVKGQVAARADSMDYDDDIGLIHLYRNPTVWSDSMQLLADSIIITAPKRKLELIKGYGLAFMVSRSDSVRPERYDQVSGDSISLYVYQDTVRQLFSIGNAKSITWRVEEDEPQGMAQFASDTIKANFTDGTPDNIYWLGAVQGEHHPENVASQRIATYVLPGFFWRTDRPQQRALPLPYSEAPSRTLPLQRKTGPEVTTGKKR